MTTLSTDLIDILEDNDGEVVYVNGDLSFSSGPTGMLQRILWALDLTRGDWYLDVQDGVPYRENETVPAVDALLGQPFDEAKWLRAFRLRILAIDGVAEILDLTVSKPDIDRGVVVQGTVRCEYGDVVPFELET